LSRATKRAAPNDVRSPRIAVYHVSKVTAGDAPTQERESSAPHGSVLAEISNAMVALHKECYGKGPTKARTTFNDNLIVCLLEGGFQRGERTLRDHGRGDAVQGQREAFQEVLRGRFVGTIERLTGRAVKAFISGVDLDSEMSAEVFVLEPMPELGDDREAVHAWAAQTQRRARELNEEQVALREEQARLTRRSGEPREAAEDLESRPLRPA
jgi:uncharacterized protein YbcI